MLNLGSLQCTSRPGTLLFPTTVFIICIHCGRAYDQPTSFPGANVPMGSSAMVGILSTRITVQEWNGNLEPAGCGANTKTRQGWNLRWQWRQRRRQRRRRWRWWLSSDELCYACTRYPGLNPSMYSTHSLRSHPRHRQGFENN